MQAFVRTGYFQEDRHNGKITHGRAGDRGIERHHVEVRQRRRARCGCPTRARCRRTIFGDLKTFNSNFLAIPDATGARGDRAPDAESDRADQCASAAWCSGRAASFGRHVLTAGADLRWVDGDSIEDALRRGHRRTQTLHRVAGGTQRSLGVFVQDVFAPVAERDGDASAPLDRWRNYDATTPRTTLSTGATVSDPVLADKDDSVVSPRARARLSRARAAVGLGRHRRRDSARRRSTSCTAGSRRARS